MEFKETKPIYLQVAERIEDEILSGVYAEEERIPSVREYAVAMEVNVNTIVRSYERLQGCGVIYNRRGLGYFVSPNAKQTILTMRRAVFLNEELDDFFRRAALLGISSEELGGKYEDFLRRNRQI